MKIIIDHEKYGARSEFDSIAEAEKAMWDCGPDFEFTRFVIRSDEAVLDEAGDIVGHVEHEAQMPNDPLASVTFDNLQSVSGEFRFSKEAADRIGAAIKRRQP